MMPRVKSLIRREQLMSQVMLPRTVPLYSWRRLSVSWPANHDFYTARTPNLSLNDTNTKAITTFCQWTGFLLCLWGSLLAAQNLEAREPFVAGYDRFHAKTDTFFDGSAEQTEIQSADWLGGELLLTELSCTACHQTKAVQWQPKGGPDLQGVGNRLQHDWLTRFLTSPAATKPGTTMPEILSGLAEKDQKNAVAALVAYLETLQTPFPELKSSGSNPIAYQFWKKGDQTRGQELYHRIGCVACHAPDPDYEGGTAQTSPLEQMLAQLDPEEIEEMGLSHAVIPVNPVPHSQLPEKYSSRSLTFFLLQPETTRAGGRMPNFQLNPQEAADLSAYLLHSPKGSSYPDDIASDDIDSGRSKSTTDDSASVESLVVEGRKLFVSLNCIECHSVKGLKPQQTTPSLADLSLKSKSSTQARSCLQASATTEAGSHKAGQPSYPVNVRQQALLENLLKNLPAAEQSLELTQNSLSLHMMQLNCYACHERNTQGGVGPQLKKYFETKNHIDIGDEGRLPPHLDGVGQKLKPGWLQKVLQGKGHIRPFLYARMPVFPQSVTATLPEQFRQADQNRFPLEEVHWSDSKELIEAGRQLLDTGCVQCHAVRGEQLPGVVGVELSTISQRVDPAWFQQFLKDPASLKPRTRMPTFFPNGRSSNQDLLDGHVEQQISALWAYLKAGDQTPLPQKILTAKSESYELKPDDHPIVLRTFMKQAGTHAIAVGYPEGLNLAFDSEQMRLAIAWPGRFLDAYGTWFVRFTPPAEPLSDTLISFPAGVPFARLNSLQMAWPTDEAATAAYRFQGYRLNSSGRPTFLYRFENYGIEEELEAVSPQKLKRNFKILRSETSAPQQSQKLTSQSDIKQQNLSNAEEVVWFRLAAGEFLKGSSAQQIQTKAGLKIKLSEDLAKSATFREQESEWLLAVPVSTDQRAQQWTLEYEW